MPISNGAAIERIPWVFVRHLYRIGGNDMEKNVSVNGLVRNLAALFASSSNANETNLYCTPFAPSTHLQPLTTNQERKTVRGSTSVRSSTARRNVDPGLLLVNKMRKIKHALMRPNTNVCTPHAHRHTHQSNTA